MSHTSISESAYSKGRQYATRHRPLPCNNYLRTLGFEAPLDRHHFACGFRDEKAADALASPADLHRVECRCGCEPTDDLPYPYFGA